MAKAIAMQQKDRAVIGAQLKHKVEIELRQNDISNLILTWRRENIRGEILSSDIIAQEKYPAAFDLLDAIAKWIGYDYINLVGGKNTLIGIPIASNHYGGNVVVDYEDFALNVNRKFMIPMLNLLGSRKWKNGPLSILHHEAEHLRRLGKGTDGDADRAAYYKFKNPNDALIRAVAITVWGWALLSSVEPKEYLSRRDINSIILRHPREIVQLSEQKMSEIPTVVVRMVRELSISEMGSYADWSAPVVPSKEKIASIIYAIKEAFPRKVRPPVT